MIDMKVGRVMVTGASGLLGSAILRRLQGEADLLALSHSQPLPGFMAVDLASEPDRVRVQAEAWDALVHCAGHRSPDFCETHREEAFTLNAAVPGYLGQMARMRGARMIHISTDYVFPGTHPPYKEGDPCRPVNIYGESKLEGEIRVAEACPDACILRIGALYGVPSVRVPSPMLEEGLTAVLAGKPVEQDHGIKRYPLLVDDVAEVVCFLLCHPEVGGVLHAGSGKAVTRYEWALLIGKILGCDTRHVKAAVSDPARRAPRPPDAGLAAGRLRDLGGPVPCDCDKALPDVLARCSDWAASHGFSGRK